MTALMASRRGHRRRILLVAVMTIISLQTPGAIPMTGGGVAQAGTVGSSDWLGSVNAYRSMSGLPLVSHQPAWDYGTSQHSCYMITNGIAHDEEPGKPGYTPEGDDAGNSSNVAVASSDATPPQEFINLWMTAPFHALGLLRPGWRQTSYGECRQPTSGGNMIAGGTLDVIRGLDSGDRMSQPVVFPGNGSTVPLYRFIAEYPNPVTACGWSGPAGLPLIAAMPADFSGASSSLTGPSGPIETCTLHKGNTSGLARDLLDWDKAVVVMPRDELADGTYSVSVQTTSGSANWSFTVARDGGLSPLGVTPTPTETTPTTTTTKPPMKLQDTKRLADGAALKIVEPYRQIDSRKNQATTRLRAGQVRRVFVASRNVEAVTANFTVVNPTGPGYLKVFDCASTPPNSSVLNYAPGHASGNLATIGLDDGSLCFLALTDADVVMDITGLLNDDGTELATFNPIKPTRAFDSRDKGVMVRPGSAVKIDLTPGVVPDGSRAVAANVAITQPTGDGHVSIHPCSEAASTSNINFLKGETLSNQSVITLSLRGETCISSHVPTHVIIDVSGYFENGSDGLSYSPLRPIRLFDSRSTQRGLNTQTGGNRVDGTVRVSIANVRGVPGTAKAAAVNLAAIDPTSATHVTVYACDGPVPGTSTLNVDPAKMIASNSAIVALSGSGEICIKSLNPTHVVVDVYGIWE